MTADNTPSRRGGRRWGSYLAGVSGGLATAAIGGATNIATNLPLPNWDWLDNPVVMWSLVVILVILIPSPLLRSNRPDGDGDGGERGGADRVGVQQVIINSPSGPVFAGLADAQPATREDLVQRDLPRREMRAAAAASGVRAGLVVTRFMSDSSGLHWEAIYNQVRIGATTTEITVQDDRNEPTLRVDILIVVHEARLVFMSQSAIQTTCRRARSALEEQPTMSIGIYLVGPECETARRTVNQWLELDPPMSPIYVIGVDSAAGLRDEMARLLQVVIDRDPRRSRPLAQADDLGAPGGLYDARMGDY